MRLAVLFLVAGFLHAQSGQTGSRPDWPCVPGRAVDPAYIETSESTGGQLFLFQKNEVAQSGPFLSSQYTHPATVLRAIGNVNGTRDFEFPVDSTIQSLLVMVSVQCRNSIVVTRPNGAPLTAANSALSTDLQAGRILQVDTPDPGSWRVRVTGTGLYVLSVMAKSDLRLTGVRLPDNAESGRNIAIRTSGEASELEIQVVDAEGNPISRKLPVNAEFVPPGQRFRILLTGLDAAARPFQRMHPVLFRPDALK